MSLSKAFREAVLALVRQSGHEDAAEIISWTEEQHNGGYCETCSYTYVTVDIAWRDAGDETHHYEYYGTFSELLDRLLNAEEESA